MKNGKILIIDDELDIGKLFSKSLPEYNVLHAITGREGIELIEKENPDLVFLDLVLPDTSGIKALKKIKQILPSAVVIVLTGYADVESAVKTMKLGAHDYLTKPLPLQRLKIIADNAIKLNKLDREVKELKEVMEKPYTLERIITVNKAMQEVLALARKSSLYDVTVLITGESGTGKELIARAIHNESNRKNGPFIAIDCATLPETLIESELFGYEKGAFTGAGEAKPGKFELADHGTIFLDEIGNLTDNLQMKLLRVLQERELVRLGGKKVIPVDVRIVTATNVDLLELVRQGSFRNDLYYRINVFPIKLLPLRERIEDIVPLSKNILERFNRSFNKQIQGIVPEVVEVFKKYPWSGNIRELENVLKSACILADDWIKPQHINGLLTNHEKITATDPASTLKETTKRAEKKLIEMTLAECRWNKRKTAQKLGIEYRTLYNKIKEYGIG